MDVESWGWRPCVCSTALLESEPGLMLRDKQVWLLMIFANMLVLVMPCCLDKSLVLIRSWCCFRFIVSGYPESVHRGGGESNRTQEDASRFETANWRWWCREASSLGNCQTHCKLGVAEIYQRGNNTSVLVLKWLGSPGVDHKVTELSCVCLRQSSGVNAGFWVNDDSTVRGFCIPLSKEIAKTNISNTGLLHILAPLWDARILQELMSIFCSSYIRFSCLCWKLVALEYSRTT